VDLIAHLLNILTKAVDAKTVILENLTQIQMMKPVAHQVLQIVLVWFVLMMNVILMNGVQLKMDQLSIVQNVKQDLLILLVTLLYY
jgi:hypothetical protein